MGKIRTGLAGVGFLLAAYLILAPKPWHISLDAENSVSDYVTVFFWSAAAINLVLLGLLAATAQLWAQPVTEVPETMFPRPRWFWPAVGTAMLITTLLGLPRLGHSVWHDEASRVRGTIAGQYKEQPDGTMRFRSAKWEDAFFQYRLPNHILQSVLSKAANDKWRSFTKPRGMQFSEAAIRLPGFLAGIASIATLALLLRNLGFASAGVFAAFLMAIHPWHIRYATEARGYAFVLALVPLLLVFLLKASQTGRWRWWGALALAEFAMIYAYATTVYVVVVLNLCVPIAIAIFHGRSKQSLVLGMRWFVTGLLAAMALFQLLLPCIPQFLGYLKKSRGMGTLDLHWMKDFMAHLLAGVPWSHTREYYSPYIELYPWFVDHPGIGTVIILAALTFFILGVLRMIEKGSFAVLAPVALILPAIVTYLETSARGGFLHEWYLIFLLPGVVAMTALGMDRMVAASKSRPAQIAALSAILLLIASYAAWTSPQRTFLVTRSIQPHRESVLLTRPSLDPNDPRQKEIITATFYGEPGPYDPRLIKFTTAKELGELARRADRENKRLYVNIGYIDTILAEHPNKYELLNDSRLFKIAGVLRGFQPSLSREVFVYRPGTAKNFDFDAVPPDKGRPAQPE